MYIRISLFALCLTLLVAQVESASFQVKNKSFRLRSSIYRTSHKQETVNVQVTESYSAKQQRAKIEYNLDSRYIFHFDALTSSSVSLNKGECQAKNRPELLKHLFGDDHIQVAALFDLIGDKNGIENKNEKYIIGTAELLYFLVQKANKLQAERSEDTEEYKVEMELKTRQGKVQVTLMYDHQSSDLLESNDRFSVSLFFFDTHKTVGIRFFDCHTFSDKFVQQEYDDLFGISSEQRLDIFAFPVGFGCSLIMNVGSSHLFEKTISDGVQFSFTAKLEDKFRFRSQNLFVAFDGNVQQLRVDAENSNSLMEVSTQQTTKIFDFDNNRKYTFATSSKSQCYVQVITPLAEQSKIRYKHISELILGGNKLVYMGQAQVRGVNTKVYEIIQAEYPFIFSDPLVYADPKGYIQQRPFGWSLTKPTKVMAVAYLATTSGNQNSIEVKAENLLLIELYDINSTPFRVSSIIEVNNFAWHLRDSPNGDRSEDVFQLKDICFDADQASTYTEVELSLALASSENYESKNHAWTENWISRNSAIRAGVRKLEVKSLTLYDLESRMISKPKFSISVRFKLAKHPLRLHEFSLSDNKKLSNSFNQMAVMSASSPGDCIWLNKDPSKSFTVFYFQHFGVCMMEATPESTGTRLGRDKIVAYFSSSATFEVYNIIVGIDIDMKSYNEKLEQATFKHIEETPVELLNPQLGPNSTLRLQVQNIKLSNYKSTNSSSDKATYRNKDSAFFSLSFSPKYSKQLKEENFQDSTEKSAINLDQCRSACLTDFDCKSYSYCVRFDKTECRTSSISLESDEDQDQLSKLADDKQRQQRGTKISLKLDDQQVELIKDVSCSLYRRDTSSMFKKSQGRSITLSEYQINPVSSQEECAQLCLAKNVKTLREYSTLTNQINKLMESKDRSSQAALDKLRDENRHKASKFCEQFFYNDGRLSNKYEEMFRRLVEIPGDFHDHSYCFIRLTDPRKLDEKQVAEYKYSPLFCDLYKIDFSYLYEKKFGVMFQASPLKQEESETLLKVHSQNSLTRTEHELLAQVTKQGKNLQKTLQMVDASECARRCFMQTSNLWPACRSFDITLDSSIYIISNCYLNSQSLDSKIIEKSVIQPASDLRSRNWHYELRSIFAREINYDDYLLESSELDAAQISSSRSFSFAAPLLTLVGICTGLALGVFVVPRYTNRFNFQSATHTDTLNLVS